MIATVQVLADGCVVACLDTDDLPDTEDERSLAGLAADSMLDQCARVAIATWLDLRTRVEDDGHSE